MTTNNPKILHLVLKGSWYDKIASGEKTSEYRAHNSYWDRRLVGGNLIAVGAPKSPEMAFRFNTPYDRVVFHRGYTSKTMEFKIAGLWLLVGKPNDLNADNCWEIKLGARIK